MNRPTNCVLPIAICIAFLAGCSSTETTTPDEPPVEPTTESPAPVEPAEAPPGGEPEATEPNENPEPATAGAPKLEKYRGKAVIALEVERKSITCVAKNEGADLMTNRRACIADLIAQVEDPAHKIIIVDEAKNQGCPTCIVLLADVTPVAPGSSAPQVLFALQNAGTVTCTSGGKDLALDAARQECWKTLQQEAGAIRAGVVLPMAIDEGEPCPSCVAIGAAGFTAEYMPR